MDLTSKMKVSDLRTVLSARGFDTRGLKSELVGRLNAALDGEADEAEDCNEVEVVAVAQADRKQKSPKMNKAKGGDIFLASGNPENLKKIHDIRIKVCLWFPVLFFLYAFRASIFRAVANLQYASLPSFARPAEPKACWSVLSCSLQNESRLVTLFGMGADVDVRRGDDSGETALIWVARTQEGESQRRAAEALLAHGADVNARDDRGNTALKYVSPTNNGDFHAYLKLHGAKGGTNAVENAAEPKGMDHLFASIREAEIALGRPLTKEEGLEIANNVNSETKKQGKGIEESVVLAM